MEQKINLIKCFIVSVTAYVTARFGLIGPVLMCLLITMLLDWVTGILASAYYKYCNPEDTSSGLSSRKGVKGIFKKIGYLIGVGVGICLDWLLLISADTFSINLKTKLYFGTVIATWFVLNELLSILENLGRMDVKMPKLVRKTIKVLQDQVEGD